MAGAFLHAVRLVNVREYVAYSRWAASMFTLAGVAIALGAVVAIVVFK